MPPPLWISEAGVPSEPIEIGGRKIVYTREGQAKDLERIYDISRKHGVAHVFWLKLIDTPELWSSNMGLSEGLEKRKPAWDVYGRLAKEK